MLPPFGRDPEAAPLGDSVPFILRDPAQPVLGRIVAKVHEVRKDAGEK
jgi:hypothetical protein